MNSDPRPFVSSSPPEFVWMKPTNILNRSAAIGTNALSAHGTFVRTGTIVSREKLLDHHRSLKRSSGSMRLLWWSKPSSSSTQFTWPVNFIAL